MKTTLFVAVGILCGFLLGVVTVTTWFETVDRARVGRPTWQPSDTTAPGGRPKATVDQETFDFGSMAVGTNRSHTFIVTNTGDAPLVLRKGDTSCKCAISKLSDEAVPPGESAEVELEWTAKGMSDSFRHTATVWTNDPDQEFVTLTVTGQVLQPLKILPNALLLMEVASDETKPAEVKILALEDEDTELLGHEFLDEATAEFFDASIEPLPADELSDPDAKRGFLLTVTLKPGHPIGPISQRLRLKTNVVNDSEWVIPIYGRVTTDITVVGRDWDPESWILSLGNFRSDAGRRRELLIFVRGKFASDTSFEIEAVFPEFLQASLGEKRKIKDNLTAVPLLVEVPAGSPPGSHTRADEASLGRIVLVTNHPSREQIVAAVEFTVDE